MAGNSSVDSSVGVAEDHTAISPTSASGTMMSDTSSKSSSGSRIVSDLSPHSLRSTVGTPLHAKPRAARTQAVVIIGPPG